MPLVTAHLSISLDGYVAGPDQSEQDPLGVGGMALHRWHIGEPTNDVDRRTSERLLAPRGAFVMGRNMFGPVRGDWGTTDWRGWWGEEPPYHAPVFVLTHHPRESIPMAGGTTFHFVGDFDTALERAVDAAGDQTVTIAGGASAVRQGLQRGVVDELLLSHAPVLLGGGERLFDGVDALDAEPVEVAASPLATHVVYRLRRASALPTS
jgi:dihydrofolate reductase